MERCQRWGIEPLDRWRRLSRLRCSSSRICCRRSYRRSRAKSRLREACSGSLNLWEGRVSLNLWEDMVSLNLLEDRVSLNLWEGRVSLSRREGRVWMTSWVGRSHWKRYMEKRWWCRSVGMRCREYSNSMSSCWTGKTKSTKSRPCPWAYRPYDGCTGSCCWRTETTCTSGWTQSCCTRRSTESGSTSRCWKHCPPEEGQEQ